MESVRVQLVQFLMARNVHRPQLRAMLAEFDRLYPENMRAYEPTDKLYVQLADPYMDLNETVMPIRPEPFRIHPLDFAGIMQNFLDAEDVIDVWKWTTPAGEEVIEFPKKHVAFIQDPCAVRKTWSKI